MARARHARSPLLPADGEYAREGPPFEKLHELVDGPSTRGNRLRAPDGPRSRGSYRRECTRVGGSKVFQDQYGYGTPQTSSRRMRRSRFASRQGRVHSLGVAFVKKGATTEGLGWATVLPPRHSSSTTRRRR